MQFYLPTAYRKVFRDLIRNKGRTVLVILSIAVGVMTVGMILTGNILMEQQFSQVTGSTNPSHVRIYLSQLVDASVVRDIQQMPDVAVAEGFSVRGVEWKSHPDADWQEGALVMVPPLGRQKLDILEYRTGTWPNESSVMLETSQLALDTPPVGGTIYFNVNDRTRAYTVGGTLWDYERAGPPIMNDPAIYVSPVVMERLLGSRLYDEIRLKIPKYTEDEAERVAELVQDKLEDSGIRVSWTRVMDPEKLWASDILDGISLILTVMAFSSLFLSVMLVVNTMNALVSQQIPQIGIMKTVGGLRVQISPLYLLGVVIYGVLSLIIAVPIGAYAGQQFTVWALGLLNIPQADFTVVPTALLVQVGAGFLVPILAALIPILQGVKIPVREALNSFGTGDDKYGKRWLDRLLGLLRGIPRLPMMSIRNTFRSPWRVALTQIVLTAAGTIFIMVLTTHFSFTSTLASIWEGFGFNASVQFSQQQRVDEVVPMMVARPNVDMVEMWIWRGATGRVPGVDGVGNEYQVQVRGVPDNTQMLRPNLTEGRMLLPEDGHAIILNQKLGEDMGLGIGDQIELDFGRGSTLWTIVGLVFDITANSAAGYVHAEPLAAELGQVGQANSAQIKTTIDNLATQEAVLDDLEAYFDTLGVDVANTESSARTKEEAEAQFNILTTVLLVMTVLIAIVGGIGLSGTLSINVLERRREIGVMRAVGASSMDVGLIFMGEGLLLGLISWAMSIPLGLWAAQPFTIQIGQIISFPVQFVFTLVGVWWWLGIVVALSMFASWLPARRATEISVRESLAYE